MANDFGSRVLRLMVFIGTRPEAIKLAPVIQAARGSGLIDCAVIATGQHPPAMLGLRQNFGIDAQAALSEFVPGLSLAETTSRVLKCSAEAIIASKPDVVVVQGDTVSTVAVAQAAFYSRVPVTHVEAGLRTNDLANPFPEEMNRRLTTKLTCLHLAPTASAQANLVREGVDPMEILVTGNTVIDALISVANRNDVLCPLEVESCISTRRPILLVTAHRRESWGEAMNELGAALDRIAARNPDWWVVFPLHPNPRVRNDIRMHLRMLPNVKLIEPLEYAQFARLMRFSRLVLTDSGGIQEEAPSLGVPVLVFREATERPEGILAGTARVLGRRSQDIDAAIQRLIDDRAAYTMMAKAVNPYGDGRAAERAVKAILWKFRSGPRPDDFHP